METPSAAGSITKREQDVLELLGAGMTNKEIAAQLEVAVRTVENHVERLLSKLEVSSRTRAIIEARRLGMLGAATAAGTDSSLAAPPHNLPVPLTRLLGREQDLAEVASLLDAHRLVTLSGSGGVGKTRLALGLGADLLDRYPQGIWFCDFSAGSHPNFVDRAVAKVLGVQERPEQPLSDAIVRGLKRKHALLIFDNCEHVVGAVAGLADEILHGCQKVRILATSREPLGIIGEIVYRVRSLAFPNGAATLRADAAMRYEAIELFVDRARGVENRFALTNDNARVVGEICRRLDGIPLAIELAAARTTVLSVESLAEKLAHHYDILSLGGRNALARHQTMRALIDWSYDHLSSAEQSLFRRLAIFAGGFNLELASAVCADRGITEIEVLDLLASLIDKSLVLTAFGDVTRYRLLESTRQYAREKLDEADEYTALAHAHAAAMAELAERIDATSESTPNGAVFRLAGPELENWRAALEWALQGRGDLRIGQRIAGSLDGVWQWYAEVEGWRWVQAALGAADETTPPALRARLELANAKIAGNTGIGRYAESMASAERARAYYNEVNDVLRLARAQHWKGRALVYMRRFAEGEAVLHDAVRAAQSLGASKCAGGILETIGHARLSQGDTSGACELWAESLALLKRAGATEAECAAFTIHLAEARFHDGKPEEALRLARDATAIYRATNYRPGLWYALMNAAAYLVAIGHFEDARTHARETLVLTRELGIELGCAVALQHVGAIAALQPGFFGSDKRESLRRAARLLGFVDARYSEVQLGREYTEQQEYDSMLAVLRNELGAGSLTKLMDEGSIWTEDQAVAEALLV